MIGGWLLFILLRPAPPGFAPTSGQALVVAGQPPDIVQYTIDAQEPRGVGVLRLLAAGQQSPRRRIALDWDLAFKPHGHPHERWRYEPRGRGRRCRFGGGPSRRGASHRPTAILRTRPTTRTRLENPALHKWYNYDWTTHIITSKNHTYALRTSTGEVVLLTFVSYYCDDGSSGCVTFRYRHVQDP